MDIKLNSTKNGENEVSFAIPLPEGLAASLDLDEETALEAYISDGNIYINVIDDEDFDGFDDDNEFACEGDCEDCPHYNNEYDKCEVDEHTHCPIGIFGGCDGCEYYRPELGGCKFDD